MVYGRLPIANVPPMKKALPFLRSKIPAIAAVLIGIVLYTVPHIHSPDEASRLYARCSALAASSPPAALELAHSWRTSRPDSATARHCEALAQFATRDFLHAAESFAALARDTANAKPALATQLYVQAAKAYTQAGKQDEASAAAKSVLAITPDNAEAKAIVAVPAPPAPAAVTTAPAAPVVPAPATPAIAPAAVLAPVPAPAAAAPATPAPTTPAPLTSR